MLVVMRSDSYLSAKGFKAKYKRTCGATIRVKDQGVLSTSTTFALREVANCSWILISDDPGKSLTHKDICKPYFKIVQIVTLPCSLSFLDDHITLTFTHMDFASPLHHSDCGDHYVQVHDGSSLDGPSLGTWCSHDVPPPITSNGNALTINLVVSVENEDHSFVAYYSRLNTGMFVQC